MTDITIQLNEAVAWLGKDVIPPRFGPKVYLRFLLGLLPREECWEWQRALDDRGYGDFGADGLEGREAHRAAYELLVGPIPDGCHLHHRCEAPACVNPFHLEALPQLEHNEKHPQRRRTHCKRGHVFDAANTIQRIDRNGYLVRSCRECRRQEWRRRAAQRKAERNAA